MSSTTTIILAEKLFSLIGGIDGRRTCETIAPGRYILSDTTTQAPQAITAANVVAGVFTWATETLDDMTSAQLEVDTARAVLDNRFDDAIELGHNLNNQLSLNIWTRVKLFAAKSGHVATLHSPVESTSAETIVTV